MPKAKKHIKRLRQLGRPRKEGVSRAANGRIAYGYDRERPEDATRTVREARQRHLGVKARDADDPKHGDALMALLKAGNGEGISQKQHDALDRWARLFMAHCRIAKGMSPLPPSPAAMMLDIAPHVEVHDREARLQALALRATANKTMSHLTSDEVEESIERNWAETYRALLAHGFEHGKPSPYSVLHSVAGMNVMLNPKDERGLGNLRIAANILIHLWRM